jgi:DNA-binding PadR family transcriptional regulator
VGTGGAWLPEQVEAEVPMIPEFVYGVLSTMTRHGLARSIAVLDGGQRFRITDLGRALLEVMNSLRAGAQPPTRTKDRA